ncbi:MAG TPA: c-type cytochrome [Candidatus Limnocylindria bacterium]|nr:c-type cytochrome [Candidatus Limnocylindria bacterium]
MRFLLPALALIGLILSAGLGRPAVAQEEAAAGSVERGAELFSVGCATCHGSDGGGIDPWPAITDAGEAAADFQLRTGRMPFTGEAGEQAQPKPPAYDPQEISDLVAFVGSLGDGPAIPDVGTDDALLQQGFQTFAVNCAPCHGATANGGAVGGGAIAWPLTSVDPRTVGEAMLTGPGQMPVFDLGDESINAVATYVEYLQSDDDPGGFEIGGIGPVPEGFVAWLVGMGLLIGVVYLVGRRWDRAGHRS